MQRHSLTVAAIFAFAAIQLQAAQPQMVSLSPASGSGQTQTFTLTASDSAGASDIASINMLINGSFTTSNGCFLSWNHKANVVQLADNYGYWGMGPFLSPGQHPGASNAQCSVEFISGSDAGNTASISVSVTFSGSWLGEKTIWGESLDAAKNDSGYQQMGAFTAVNTGPSQDFTVSVTPMNQNTTRSHTVDYDVVITSVNGFTGPVDLTSSYNPDPGGLTVREQLVEGSSGTVPPDGTSRRTIHVDTSATTATATNPADKVTISFTYTDNNLQHTVPVTLFVAPPSLPTTTISPGSGTGGTQTFSITASDPGGWAAISQINFLIAPTLDGRNACWFFYQADNPQSTSVADGLLTLASDNGGDWSNTTRINSTTSSPTPIHNNQCDVFGGPTTVRGDGNTLTLTLSLAFTPSFAGDKNLYVRAMDQAGPDTGYLPIGTFTTAPSYSYPDFSLGVDPGSQTVTGQAKPAYSVVVTGANGYNGIVNLTVTGLPPNSTLSPPSPTGPGHSSVFTVNTTGSTPEGTYTLTVTGTDGSLNHSVTTTLVVQTPGVPTVSASPNTGSGATQTVTFTVTGQDASAPNSMNVLFNTTVDGRNGCWMFYGGGSLDLASDDGAIWTSTIGGNPPLIQNNQCALTSFTPQYTAGQLKFSVTITFSHAFAGTKNIFVRGDNTQGGDTGYQLQGTWTVP